MGWWKTGNGDDIIGDDPADEIGGMLRFHTAMTKEKPTFQELLDVTADLVHLDGELFLSDPQAAESKALLAVFKPPAPTLRSEPVETNSLTLCLAVLYEKIAAQYLATGHARKPRLTELLAALAFILRANPGKYLREAEGLELEEFRVEP